MLVIKFKNTFYFYDSMGQWQIDDYSHSSLSKIDDKVWKIGYPVDPKKDYFVNVIC